MYDAAAGTPFKVRRLPGYGILEKNDIIIFNGTFTESWDSVAMNMYRYYCKRAVAVAGDTLEIRDGHYRVSGFDGTLGVESEQMQVNYYKNYLSTLPDSLAHPGWFQSLPYDGETGWTIADFGPIVVPAVGTTISIDLLNYRIYRKYIAWETGTQPEWSDDRAWLGDTPLDSYTFTENYCFAAGDHRFVSTVHPLAEILLLRISVGSRDIIPSYPFERRAGYCQSSHLPHQHPPRRLNPFSYGRRHTPWRINRRRQRLLLQPDAFGLPKDVFCEKYRSTTASTSE